MALLTLQTTTFSRYGGIPTYNQLICRVLNDCHDFGASHVLAVMDDDKAVAMAQQSFHYRQLQLEAFNGDRKKFVQRVLSLVVRHKIDLMLIGHVNYAPLGWLLRRLQPGMRYGVMIYGVEAWTKLPRMRRRALEQADFIVSISHYTKQRAVEVNGARDERVYILPNALACEERQRAPALTQQSLPAGTRLLSVCRLDRNEQYKGVDYVIEALPAISLQVPDVQYFVVGGGTDIERHKQLAVEVGVADRVHFLGFVDASTLRACYQTCDIFVMPSGGEGFGFVFLEAMQYGKPVVAANSGGAPEVVQDSVTGALVKYGDVAQLTETLVRLCLDPSSRARMGQAGYERLHQHFNFPRFKQTLIDILSRELPADVLYNARRRTLFDAQQIV